MSIVSITLPSEENVTGNTNSGTTTICGGSEAFEGAGAIWRHDRPITAGGAGCTPRATPRKSP